MKLGIVAPSGESSTETYMLVPMPRSFSTARHTVFACMKIGVQNGKVEPDQNLGEMALLMWTTISGLYLMCRDENNGMVAVRV